MAPVRVFFDFSVDGEPLGRVIFELFTVSAPKTCENFRSLCTGERGLSTLSHVPLYYKNSTIHRSIPSFMIQGGDFTRHNGTGGESIYGSTFADEDLSRPLDVPGLLCMANKGPNTNGSQFFITLAPASHLDGRHVVFGRVVRGFEEVVLKIAAIPTDTKKDRPTKPVVISNCGELELRKPPPPRARSASVSASASESEKNASESEGGDERGRGRSKRRDRSPSADSIARSRSRPPSRLGDRSRSPAHSNGSNRSRSRSRSEDRSPKHKKAKKDKKSKKGDRKEKKERKEKKSKKRKHRSSTSPPPGSDQENVPHKETEEEYDARLEREERERLAAARRRELEAVRQRLLEEEERERRRAKEKTNDAGAEGGVRYKGRGRMKYLDPEMSRRHRY